MMYVICNPEDLLEGPNGVRLAPAGIDAYKSPGTAMTVVGNNGQYWEDDIYPCDATADDCKVVGEREVERFRKEPRVILSREVPVCESKRMSTWITFCSREKDQVGRLTALSYAFIMAGMPFMVSGFANGVMGFKCLSKHRSAAEAVMGIVTNAEIKIGPVFEMVTTPVTMNSRFDAL